MKKPFSILQLRIHLQALHAEAITFSKLVEILNETAANPTRHQWVSFTDEQPADGQKIILQYKTFAFDNVQYDASAADYYTANCLRWLNQKGKENAAVVLKNQNMEKELELDIVELKISIRAASGEVFKVDMNTETQRLFFSLVNNFFKQDIPFVEDVAP